MKVFSTRFRAKFQPIQIDERSVSQLADCGIQTVTPEMNAALKEPISLEELRHAATQGKAYKAPGHDGICLEFFRTTWDVLKLDLLQIMNHMYIEGRTTARQLQELIVCLPKNAHPKNVDDYRPLVFLNTDYKTLTRLTANRLRPCLAAILHPNQHCGIQGNSAFEAVATVRQAVAHAEVTTTPLCIVSIDFSAALDKISHFYLLAIVHAHGFTDWFLQRIMGMYSKAAMEVQINGFRSNLMPIHSSIRQGCPLSTQLFALCLNPLIQTLERRLKGIQIGRGHAKMAVIAYADDVTIFLTSPVDVRKLQETLLIYEAATGAKVNMRKSRALALGTWDTTTQIMDIPYHTDVKIMGLHFTNKVNTSANEI